MNDKPVTELELQEAAIRRDLQQLEDCMYLCEPEDQQAFYNLRAVVIAELHRRKAVTPSLQPPINQVQPLPLISIVEHVEGGVYNHIGAALGAGQSKGLHVEVYQGADGCLWVRDPEDFDMRFTEFGK